MTNGYPVYKPKEFKYSRGMYVKSKTLESTTGSKIEIPNGKSFVHLQFRRFAGCPVCNLHLQSFATKQRLILDSGIQEIIVFHSSRAVLLKYTSGFPFHLVADPKKQLSNDFGVESSPWAILNPSAFIPIIKGVANSTMEFLRGKRPLPSFTGRRKHRTAR